MTGTPSPIVSSASPDCATCPLPTHATNLLAEIDGLHCAMETRATIEQAKGIIMMREHCDPDTAFDILVGTSQRRGEKVRDVAAALVAAVQTG